MSEIEIGQPNIEGKIPTYLVEHSALDCLDKLTEEDLWIFVKDNFSAKRTELSYAPGEYMYDVSNESGYRFSVGFELNPTKYIGTSEDFEEEERIYLEHFGAIPETSISINLGSTDPKNYESMELSIDFIKVFQKKYPNTIWDTEVSRKYIIGDDIQKIYFHKQ